MFTGCGTALITPFLADGAVDESALRRLVKRQIDAGINFLVPCGTTGESPTLNRREHLRVVEITLEEAKGKVPVLGGAGGYNTAEVIELAGELRHVGVDGILSVTPYYNKPTQEGLYRHYRAVAENTKLPIILYSVPGRCGIEVGVETAARLARDCPNIVCIKEAGGSVDRVNQLRAALPAEFTIISGDDAIALPSMAAGAAGVISVASNIIPKEMSRMIQAFADGRATEASELHQRFYPLFKDLTLESNPIPIKTAVSLAGRISGEFRLPLCEMAPANAAKLLATLRNLNLVK